LRRAPRSLAPDPAATPSRALSLHDALPIWPAGAAGVEQTAAAQAPVLQGCGGRAACRRFGQPADTGQAVLPLCQRSRRHAVDFEDRKSTRLNSSHVKISYAVFCLKKKTKEP